MPSALALSPHLDDAVFSCGGTLAKLAHDGWDVTVCTVFTRSVLTPTGFALACQLDKGLPPDIDYMALRRGEDTCACAILGVKPRWLNLLEAPHRNYPDAKSLFLDPRDDDDFGLRPLLREVLNDPPALLLAPQALGGHVDHVLLVRALLAERPTDLPILWWADFPYAIRSDTYPARPFAQHMDALPPVSLSGDPSIRLAACAAYASQIRFQFPAVGSLERALSAAGPMEHFRAEGALPFQ